MPTFEHPCLRNSLLSLVPEIEFEAIAPVLEPIELPRGTVLVNANAPIDYVYFLVCGIGSVVTVSTEGRKSETGMFGREGYSPTSAGVGGTISVHEASIQVGGSGFRMPLATLSEAVEKNPTFANLLARYIQAFSSQIAYTAMSNANHQVDERLARWLLMCHDRIDGDEIALTHDFISLMLAVRRPSVTTAMHVLEGKKLIIAERGRITIRDRMGLLAFAGGAYGPPEEEYRRLIGEL